MNSFTFQTAPNILFEVGAIRKVAAIASGLSARSVLLVTDKGVRDAGLTAGVEMDLRDAGIALSVFDEVRADPPSSVIESAADICRAAGAGLVVAIGGGSALDTAKLAAYLARTPDTLDAIYGVGGAKAPASLVLAPTTAGTGSEVTPIAIVTTPSGEKRGVVSPVLLPDWAILDPELTLGLPSAATAATGIDAMVHAIEAYTSRHRKNPLSDQLALQALALLTTNIRRVCSVGRDIEARGAMSLGSMLAGMAFGNAPVAAVHALAYPIGARFHVPHGLSNALVMAPVLRFNLPSATREYAELADILRPESRHEPARARAERFVADMSGLCADCGVPRSLAAVGIAAADIRGLAEDAMRQQRLLVNNPREVGYADAVAIYREAL